MIDFKVFMDSQVIIQENFLDGSGINALLEKNEKGEIDLYTSEIVVREVLRKFEERYEAARGKWNNSMVFKNIPRINDLLEKLNSVNPSADLADFEKRFRNRLKKAKVTILPIAPKDVAVVMEQYFRQEAPFGPQKTKEFPDAFNVQIIEEEIIKSGGRFVIISRDGDFKSLNSKNITSDILSNILSLATQATQPKDLIQSLTKSAYNSKEEIQKVLEEGLNDFTLFRFPEYWDFDLESVKVNEMEIESVLIEHYRRYTVLVMINVKAELEITVSYIDTQEAYYDKEDDVYTGAQSIQSTYTVVAEFPIVCEADALDDGLEDFVIKSINSKKGIMVNEGPHMEILDVTRIVKEEGVRYSA